MDKVSVIVPVYKVEDYLDICVESIVCQTYKNLEIILIDDGSPDSCPQKCDIWAEKDSRIKVIHKKNEGVSAARNFGIEVATGKYISFIDSDDFIDNQMFEHMVNGFRERDVQLVVCGLYRGEKRINSADCKIVDQEQAYKMLFDIRSFPYFEGYVWNKLYLTSVIKEEKLQFDMTLKMCEDTLFNFHYLRCIQTVVLLNVCEYHYVIRDTSVMCVKPIENDLKMVELIENFLANAPSATIYNNILSWAFKYWIQVLDDYILYGEGKQYQDTVIKKIRSNKSYILRSECFPKVEKIFTLCICYCKWLYCIYKKIKYLKKQF